MDFSSDAFHYRHLSQQTEAPPTAQPSHTIATSQLNPSAHCILNDNAYASNLSLKQQVMLNQFISIAGCSNEQALSLLSASNWQYQSALSVFFDEFPMTQPNNISEENNANKSTTFINSETNKILNHNTSFTNLSLCAPSNTPVTPPNLDYLEKAFSLMAATTSSSPSSNFNINPVNNSNNYK